MASARRQSVAHRSSSNKISSPKTPPPKYLNSLTQISGTSPTVRTCDHPRKSPARTTTPYRFRYASPHGKMTPFPLSRGTLRRGPARKAKLLPLVEEWSVDDDTDEDEISMDESKFEAVMRRRRSLSHQSKDTAARTPLRKKTTVEPGSPSHTDYTDFEGKAGDYMVEEGGNGMEDLIVVKLEKLDDSQPNPHKGPMIGNLGIFETSWKENSDETTVGEVEWENRRLMDEILQLKTNLEEERAKSAQLEWKLSVSMGRCVVM